MTCSACGAVNQPGQKFCGECGTRLATGCPNCGATNPPGQKFCGECGTTLAALPSPAGGTATAGEPARAAGQPAAPGGASGPQAERRLVSVMFADLVGFTPFAEERDAEDVRDTLTRYFDLAREVIERYGGTVEKFIGDAVMAVWGAPTAREDDAERAVRAALDLVDAVRSLGPTIQARAGVLTGEAAVTIGATNQGMVAGDLVNTAARLQSVAPPGTVLVGDGTHRAAEGSIAFDEAGDQVLKGKSSPVPAWRALRVVAQRRGQGRSKLPEPPFVGRDEEFRVLKDLLSASSRDPRVRVASITGPGGIGKSRLAWELEKYIDGLVEPVYWHRGRSPSYGEGVTFWALGEMVRQRAGLAESYDEATTRSRLAATVAEYVLSADDRHWVEPALLTLLGLEPPPPGGRDVLFAAWRIFFERIAAGGTTVLLFEDLQWADSGLLDFIDHIVEWAKGLPILIVTLARPELFERRPTWGAGTRNFTALALEPLSEGAMRTLLDGFVPGLPAKAVAAILARADGIPLYAVETIRALVAEGRLVQVDGAYRPVGELGELAIPETLQSLIGSRLDALDAPDRSLIQDAAVLGQTFTPAGLSAVNGTPEADLEPRLRSLVRREVLEVQADPRSPERGQYAFVQSLIREVAYSTLARRERRARHLAVARHFEMLGEDELAGALANHYLSAYHASAPGAEAEAVAAQARLALRGAAARAASLGAHEQAVTLLRQALDVPTHPAARGHLPTLGAARADAVGTYPVALDLARLAREEYERAGQSTAVVRANALAGRIMVNGGLIKEAVEALDGALAALPDTSDDAARADILVNLSRALFRSGQPGRAVDVADGALAIAERLDLEEILADAFNNKGAGLSYLGRSREAAALMEAAIKVAEAGGFRDAETRARNNLASGVWGREPARALEIQLAAHQLAQRLGDRRNTNWALGQSTAGLYFAGRDWDWAIAATTEAIASGLAPNDEALLTASRGLMLVPRGDPTDESLARLEVLSEQISDPSAPAQVRFLRGDRAFMAGDLDAAFDEMVRAADYEAIASIYLGLATRPALWLRDASRLRTLIERLILLPDAHETASVALLATTRAGLAALEGRHVDALAGYRDAFRRYRDIGYDFEFARSVLDGLVVLGAAEPDLRRSAEEARAVFERVGATPYVAFLDAALAGQPDAKPARAGRSVEATA